ncbi:type VI secretion system baseplate subunit TssF [Escherichia coli]|nr:type VI secretion system baseplate subunit TssF [Escherichia coli]
MSEDPHIQRLTESFAFLSSRIHQRLDEDLPELMEALLRNLAPPPIFCITTPHHVLLHLNQIGNPVE